MSPATIAFSTPLPNQGCLLHTMITYGALLLTLVLPPRTSLVSGAIYPSVWGEDMRIMFDEHPCAEDNKGGKYRVSVTTHWLLLATSETCTLMPTSNLLPDTTYTIQIYYYGKRLTRNGQCRGLRKYRHHESADVTTPAWMGSFPIYISTNSLHNSEYAMHACAMPNGAVETFGYTSGPSCDFEVRQTQIAPGWGSFWKFRQFEPLFPVSPGQCLVPASSVVGAPFVMGDCHSCNSLFRKLPNSGLGSRIRHHMTGKCMVNNPVDGNPLHLFTCTNYFHSGLVWDTL